MVSLSIENQKTPLSNCFCWYNKKFQHCAKTYRWLNSFFGLLFKKRVT